MEKPITLVLPYYRNPGMLDRQQSLWATYEAPLRSRLHVVVVDDGSPEEPAADCLRPVPGLGSLQLYRIQVDVRWNWLACRNLGVKKAATDWCLLTDIDHLVPEATLRNLVRGSHDKKCIYRFSRRNMDGSEYKPHPNSWFLTRKRFWAVGGYDENFSGWYGTDYDFRDRAEAGAKMVVMLDDFLIRVGREDIPDASTTTYERKTEEDREMVGQIRRRLTAQAERPFRHLSFPWVRQL